jgi:nitroreductase
VLAALGYRAWDRGVFSSGKGPSYAAWQEWQGHPGEGSKRPLHAAILAASAHNSQPWLFEPQDDSITIYADRPRNLGAFDPFRREMQVSLGCALANLQLAAWRFGLEAVPEIAPGRLSANPSNEAVAVASVSLRPGAAHETRLFDAIASRHTQRGAYRDDPTLAKAVVDVLEELSVLRGYAPSMFVLIDDPAMRKDVGTTIIEATEAIIADAEMSADSGRWYRTGRREIEAHRDGVTTDTAGLPPFVNGMAKLLPDQDTATADRYWLKATREVQVPTAAKFGLIVVPDRLDRAQALNAGLLWQRFHLAATLHGLGVQPMNQPLEMADRELALAKRGRFRHALAEFSGMPGWEAAFVFRLGYAGREAKPSPRRRFEAVIRRTGFA